MKEPRKRQKARIEFDVAGREGDAPTLKVTGISEDLMRSPEKIRQLMEVLELPEGTTATVTVLASTVIIR